MKRTIIFPMICASICGASIAQDSPSTNSKKVKQKSEYWQIEEARVTARDKALDKNNSDYLQADLDLNLEIIPKNFKGHSCFLIASKIRKMNPQKGEFETTSEYTYRSAAFKTNSLYGKISGDSMLGFLRPQKSSLSVSYDADRQLMKVRVHLLGKTEYLPGGGRAESAIINKDKVETSSYMGSNSFGKTVKVTRTGYDVCAIASTGNSGYFLGPSSTEVEFKISVPEARVIKDTLSVLYVGKIDAPYHVKYSDYSKPTIDDPFESYSSGDLIPFNLTQVWIFDRVSGVIFAKAGG